MTRQVLTPGQDEELEVSTGLDAKMQDTDPLNESEEGDADCREMGPTERLAGITPHAMWRYHGVRANGH